MHFVSSFWTRHNNCLELPQLKPLVHEAFLESKILEVHVDLLVPPMKLKILHRNHPYALCDHHGHYSHYFPHLDEFFDFLWVIRKYKATRSGSYTPLPVDFDIIIQLERGHSGPKSLPPDVEMMDTKGHTLYLSSSLSSSQVNLSMISMHTSIKPLSTES